MVTLLWDHAVVIALIFSCMLCLNNAEETAKSSKVQIPDVNFEFLETFQVADIFENGWVMSTKERYSGQKWKHEVHEAQAFEDDKALLTGVRHKHYGIVKVLDEPLDLAGKDVVFQYEARFHNTLDCSGAYLKFLQYTDDFNPGELTEASPYVVMFGPDACGHTTRKIHLIFRHQNPVTKEFEEKHCIKNVNIFTANDKKSHLFTLKLRNNDQSFQIFVDHKLEMEGFLTNEKDFKPPFNPPEEIDDPDDKKPDDWVDEAKIPDPDAVKPDDWDEDAPKKIPDPKAVKPSDWLEDEPTTVPDPDAEKPDDWDDEDDGEWEAPPIANPKCASVSGCGKWSPPLIDNPDYKGKWTPPMIDNPEYKGIWKPRRTKNPHYFYQQKPLDHLPKIGAVAIEILANEEDIQFDNILISTDEKKVEEFAQLTFDPKAAIEEQKLEQIKKQTEKDKRLKALEEGGFSGMMEYASGEFVEFVSSNMLLSFTVLIILCASLVYYCLFFSSSKKTAAHKKDDDATAAEVTESKVEGSEKKEEENAEAEEIAEGDDEGEVQKVRRRTRRAD